MNSVRGLLGLAIVLTGSVATVSAPQAQQAPSRNQIMYDDAGRQLENPRDRAARPTTPRRSETPETKRELGRFAVDNGTMGLETEKKLKPDELPDGRPMPAIESRRKQNNSPFVGFSLSVPTN